ncbi:hypothetical protein B7494_g5953 [Chlorociboria aeruginascens]|nr:hypothetical protein B7494_g5953 [Chlorociboria aeruginascens]
MSPRLHNVVKMSLGNLPALVRDKFKAAQITGDLTFYETQLALLRCSGLPIQVRFSPALAQKPKSNKSNHAEKNFDPFLNPAEGLLIGEVPPYHNLVLNRFPIIPDHFILATKQFKEQTYLLQEEDLEATYQCIKEYRDNGDELFGFFNSGEHSGASQSHRHIQFLPVNSMHSGMTGLGDWKPLLDNLIADPQPEMPFTYFSAAIPENPSAAELHQIYTKLHKMGCRAVEESVENSDGTHLSLHSDHNESSISYNLGFTHKVMALCPRVSEGIVIKSETNEDVGLVALNGTLLAGTILVKSELEWSALRKDESKLKYILGAIGIPPVHSLVSRHTIGKI